MSASSRTASPSVTAALGAWASELTFDMLPREVVDHLELCLLDGIGCGLFGATQRWGRIAGDAALALSGGGAASLFARIERVSITDAALANGTAIHGFEIDDIHVASSLHPAAVVVPAVLAIGEAQGLSGRELLTAMAAGYEVGLRVGVCAGVSHSTSGYHVTGTVGAVAAAAAAARAMKLAAPETSHALALGATQASGLYAARLGAMAKRFHAGRAAQSGVLAAVLAARGFTGAADAIEAPFGGFMSTLKGQHEPASMLDRLGQRWEIPRVGFKAYAACASAHTTIDAVARLMRDGLSPDNLERLTVSMSKKGFTNVGWAYAPAEVITAQMNGSYAAAVQLLFGEAGIAQYAPQSLADPRVLDLIGRMRFVHDPTLDAGGAAKRHAVKAVAELSGGRRLETYVEQRRGSAEHPLSVAELERKFAGTASAGIDSRAVEALAALIGSIDGSNEPVRLFDLMAGRG